MGSKAAIVFVSVLFILVKPSITKYEEGHLVTHENWAFLTRFCFLSEVGEFEYHIEYSADIGPLNLLLYYDTNDQWPAVYKTNKTCHQKEAVLNVNNSQIVRLTVADSLSGCSEQGSRTGSQGTVKGSKVMRCTKARRFRSARERWWFIAISNCNSTRGINLVYKLIMTNGMEGDYWRQHLSADEFYVLPVLIVFCIAYMILLLAIVMCSVELKARQFLHATYKLFIVSVALEEVGIMAQGLAYVRYSVTGVINNQLKNFGRMAESTSEACFLLLLLLLAKGYTVTRGRLRLPSSIKLTIFICLYIVVTMSLFMYERQYFDPGEVLYLYDSPAGYGIITLRIVAWWMFIYSIVFTLKHYPEKANFYYPFNLIGTLWFVSGPSFILAANNLIDKWVRESVVCAVLHFIAFMGHLLFLLITLPSKANKNFPFHVRTNQIGVMEVSGVAGNNTLYNFGHHPYEPGGPRTVPMDLFTVAKHLDMSTNPADFDTDPYPHIFPDGYTQTILVPFTIRENSGSTETSLDGSPQHNSPTTAQTQLTSGPQTAHSAQATRTVRNLDSRLIVSAGNERRDSWHPSAPLEEMLNDSSSRPATASTVSASTAERTKEQTEERARQEALALQKLTDMFVPQGLKHPD